MVSREDFGHNRQFSWDSVPYLWRSQFLLLRLTANHRAGAGGPLTSHARQDVKGATDVQEKFVPVLIVGGGPVGLALAGDLGWRGIECLLIEQTDGSIYQPRMDLVGIRTMEFCRRWGLVPAVEGSPYPRDYAQDNVYLTSLTGYELGRERFPGIGEAPPPPQSPQRRERCPQNMFDPILRDFAASQKSVTLRYRTRLVSFAQNPDAVIAEVENAGTGAREQIETRYIVGCDGARSLVRETLGIRMLGNPVLTYTTNVIFRCPHLLSLHDKRKAYRHIFIGPEGTWSTIVAINGRDQWRFSIIGGSQQHEYTTEEIKAAIRRAVGRDFEFEILSVLPWVRRELVAETYQAGCGFIAGDAAHAMSPTGGFGMNTGIGDAVDLSWKLAATLGGWGGDGLLDSYTAERQPVGARNVAEASGNLRRMLSVGAHPDIADDTPQGAATREKVGREFTEMMRREWFTLGIHLGYRYEGSPICWPDGTKSPADDARSYVPTARPGHRAPHAFLADGRSTLDLFGRGFALLGFGATAAEAAPLIEAARSRRVPIEFVAIDEPHIAALYERRFVLVRPDGHVAWRDDRMPVEPLRLIDVARGAVIAPRIAVWNEPANAGKLA
jgi:2-polyprenyl-6-methoxyphenol hydroxylase-like FAD-dependent oxidoreductase